MSNDPLLLLALPEIPHRLEQILLVLLEDRRLHLDLLLDGHRRRSSALSTFASRIRMFTSAPTKLSLR